MASRSLRLLPGLILALAIPVAACKKAETTTATTTTTDAAPAAVAPMAAVHITEVQTGKSVGADKKVQSPTDVFAPADTIFTVVTTDGSAPAAVISYKLMFEDGQVVKTDSRSIAPTGPANTEFSVQKPSGWPKGNYKSEVSVDNGPVTTKNFKVQ